MTRERLLDEVMWRGAIEDRSNAEAAVQVVLGAVGALLGPADVREIAGSLPSSLAAALEARGGPASDTPRPIYEWLAAYEDVSLGLAVEHMRAACEALAACLGEEPRLYLARRLPPAWAALFAQPPRAREAETPPGTIPGHGHTLATGRPGSRHPLAEAAPGPAQADSVVSSENPHGDTKLSSASEDRRR